MFAVKADDAPNGISTARHERFDGARPRLGARIRMPRRSRYSQSSYISLVVDMAARRFAESRTPCRKTGRADNLYKHLNVSLLVDCNT
jgi:hypothetical protein